MRLQRTISILLLLCINNSIPAYANDMLVNLQDELHQRISSFSRTPLCSNAPSFLDIQDVTEETMASITNAQEYCIVSGKSPGIFSPHARITRAEIAKMLVQAFHIPVVANNTPFYDVPANEWFSPYVSALYQAGVIEGYHDRTFRPHQLITNAELMKMTFEAAFMDTSLISHTITFFGHINPRLDENVRKETQRLGIFPERWYFQYMLLWDIWFSRSLARSMPDQFAQSSPTRGEAIDVVMRLRNLRTEDVLPLMNWVEAIKETPDVVNTLLILHLLEVHLPRAGEFMLGTPEGKYILIEYGSLEEPFSKVFHGTMTSLLLQRSDIQWIFRHADYAPLSKPDDDKEMEAVRCAGEQFGGKAYWFMLENLLGEEAEPWSESINKQREKLGLNDQTSIPCEKNTPPNLYSVTDRSRNPFISGVPTSFLLERKTGRVEFLPGARSLEELEAILDE